MCVWTEAGLLQFQSLSRVLAGSRVSTIEALPPCLCARGGKRVSSTVTLSLCVQSREKVCHLSPRLTRKSPLPTTFVCLFFPPLVIFCRSLSESPFPEGTGAVLATGQSGRKKGRKASRRARSPSRPSINMLPLKFSSAPKVFVTWWWATQTINTNTTHGKFVRISQHGISKGFDVPFPPHNYALLQPSCQPNALTE